MPVLMPLVDKIYLYLHRLYGSVNLSDDINSIDQLDVIKEMGYIQVQLVALLLLVQIVFVVNLVWGVVEKLKSRRREFV